MTLEQIVPVRHKRKRKVVVKKDENGFYQFYVGKKNITRLWMDFFSGLTLDKEANAEKSFLEKYKNL